jgi:hypothetical protein
MIRFGLAMRAIDTNSGPHANPQNQAVFEFSSLIAAQFQRAIGRNQISDSETCSVPNHPCGTEKMGD